MKKLFFLAVIVCLLIAPFVNPLFNRSIGDGTEKDYSALKNTIIKGIDNSIGKINDLENKVQANNQITSQTKNSIVASLGNVENAMLQYKAKVEQTQTLAELQAVNQEIIQYLKENKDVLRNNAKEAIKDIAENAATKAEELKEKAEQMLKLLKVSCPSEKEAIESVESLLTQLETEISLLKQAAQSKDTQAIKQQITSIYQLSAEIFEKLQQINNNCTAE